MSQVTTINVADVVFDRAYYTRTESQSPAKVQEYAKSIAGGMFPPILVSESNILLDGWHRWMAAKECHMETLETETLDTTPFVVFDSATGETKPDLFVIRRKAARANFRHGLQQTEGELKKMIRDEYRSKMEHLDQKGRSALKKDMADDYSRSVQYIRDATSRIDKDLKVELRETAFNMWMACHSQQEIAEEIGYAAGPVNEFLKTIQVFGNADTRENEDSSENPELANDAETREFDEEEDDGNKLGVYQLDKRLLIKADHMDEHFKPPVYNIWKQQDKSNAVSHFGNSEITWLDNLLYLYTKPFDIVVDPFAGGGSTIDLCKTRLRRFLVSDRKPIDIRRDIRRHDIKDGVLSPPQWKDVRLVYLDPPYWKQAENQYSQDGEDLGNMTLEQFNDSLAGLIKQYAEKLKRSQVKGAYIALIIQPTQWKSDENKTFTDHIGDMLRAVKLPVHMRYSAPYESQQCTAQMVEWAKANKRCLVLTREIIVWGVA